MAIRKVARMGHPVLREPARDLTAQEIKSPAIRALIDDMIETMHEYGGIGLAAPQVHESVRLAIIELETEDAAQPLKVFINPKITVLDPTPQSFWEGCLSVPGLRGLVPRPRKVQVDYLDQNGKKQTWEAENFLATVFQHEFDHLDGVLYVDRIVDKTKLSFQEEYEKYSLPAEDSGEHVLPD